MNPRLARALLAGGLLLTAIATALEVIVPDPHKTDPEWTSSWFHAIPGWNAILGFGGCVAIVVISKFLGKIWLQKPEDYYRG